LPLPLPLNIRPPGHHWVHHFVCHFVTHNKIQNKIITDQIPEQNSQNKDKCGYNNKDINNNTDNAAGIEHHNEFRVKYRRIYQQNNRMMFRYDGQACGNNNATQR